MNFRNIHRNLMQIEADTDVFDIKVQGIPIWERIRFNVHRQLMYALDEWETEEPEVNSALSTYARKLWLWGRNLLVRNPFFAGSHAVLYWGHHRRKKRDDGLWWDLYTDPIHDKIEQDYLQVELPHFNEHHTPAKTGNLRYLDLIQISAGIQRKLGLKDSPMTAEAREELNRVADKLRRVFDVEIDVLELAQQSLVERAATKPLYKRFLDRVDPSVVVLVIHNGKETFVEVCQEQGIPVVELQQAILNRYEYAYSFPGTRTKETFPDYLFTWGEFWNEQAAYPIPNKRVIAVGYPYLEMRTAEESDAQTKDQVLFISQPNIGEKLSEIAVEVGAAVDSNIVYKLHPHEYDNWREQYPCLIDSNVRVEGSGNATLYRLFATSRAQVGVFSTALYEGLSFGLDTYLMDLPGVEHLASLYDDGPAVLMESTEELANSLQTQYQGDFNPTRFFKHNAVNNIHRELNRIV